MPPKAAKSQGKNARRRGRERISRGRPVTRPYEAIHAASSPEQDGPADSPEHDVNHHSFVDCLHHGTHGESSSNRGCLINQQQSQSDHELLAPGQPDYEGIQNDGSLAVDPALLGPAQSTPQSHHVNHSSTGQHLPSLNAIFRGSNTNPYFASSDTLLNEEDYMEVDEPVHEDQADTEQFDDGAGWADPDFGRYMQSSSGDGAMAGIADAAADAFANQMRAIGLDADDDALKGQGRRESKRGRGRPRGSRARGSTRGPRSAGEQYAVARSRAERGKMRRPRGEGLRGGGKGKRGPRRAATPPPEVTRLINQGNQALLDKKPDEALAYALEAIQINAEIWAAHSLASEALREQGKYKEALALTIQGAVVKRDPELWRKLIEDCDTIEGLEEAWRIKWKWFCAVQLSQVDQSDWDVKYLKLQMRISFGWAGTAMADCDRMLKMRPHDRDILMHYAEICVRWGQHDRAIDKLEESIGHFVATQTQDDSDFDWAMLDRYLELLDNAKRHGDGWRRGKTLSRWLVGRTEESFWDVFDDDREWDVGHSPRRLETPGFDPEKYDSVLYGESLPMELRVRFGLLRLHAGQPHYAEALRHFEYLDPDDTSGAGLIQDYSDLYSDTANALQAQKLYSEALRFYDPLAKYMPVGSQTTLTMARCCAEVGRDLEAIDYYKKVRSKFPKDPDLLIQLVRLYKRQEMRELAAEAALDVVGMNRRDLLRKDHLTDVLPKTGPYISSMKAPSVKAPRSSRTSRPVRSLAPAGTAVANEAILPAREEQTASRAGPSRLSDSGMMEDDDDSMSVVRERKPRSRVPSSYAAIPHERHEAYDEAKIQHQAVLAARSRLAALWSAADDGDPRAVEEATSNAEVMCEEFFGCSAFYTTYSKQKTDFTGYLVRHGERYTGPVLTEMARVSAERGIEEISLSELDRISYAIPTQFHGIPFDTWLEVLCFYIVLLARQNLSERCWEVVQKSLNANIWHKDTKITDQLNAFAFAAAVALRDENRINELSRFFIKRHPYASDAYQLYAAIFRAIQGDTDAYRQGPAQKFILRQVKQMDYALLDEAIAEKFYNFSIQEKKSFGVARGKIDEMDPTLCVMYAHVMAAGASYLPALNYYFRAYAVRPDDPVLNLSIATAYVQHAVKRQAENRHYEIQQGLAFLYRYKELRARDNVALHAQEAEFNVGRVWHMLGLQHLAIPSYERVLELSKKVREEQDRSASEANGFVEDFAREAAFALQQIRALSDDVEGAMEMTREWLVID